MKAYKPEVQVITDGDRWCRNGLVFATMEEAEANARHLMSCWILVTACRGVEVEGETPNYRWVDGHLEPIEGAK
jgi:hypothetical protein